MLAVGGGYGDITLWDVATRQLIGRPTMKGSDVIFSLAFSPDGKTLASGFSKSVMLWDVATGKPIGQPLPGNTATVFAVAFSPDGKTLASSGY